MINKLNALKRRYEELTAALSAPDAMNDQAAWREMVKEHSQLEEIVNAFDEYTAAVQSEADCKAMLEEHLDPEMKEMVHMEMAELAEKQRKLIEDMKIMLLPKDPNDEKNVILEIRAGIGGDEAALFAGDILATGFWAARIAEISEEDTLLIIGAGPTGICTLLCAMLRRPRRIIVCERSPERRRFVEEHYPEVLVTAPGECRDFVRRHSDHGGADRVLEVAGSDETFRLAWECARPNAVVVIVALYDGPQVLPLPEMYGKNLTFKTGGVDGCDCAEILRLIAEGRIDTTPLITHRYPLDRIMEAYRLFESRAEGVIKVAVECRM